MSIAILERDDRDSLVEAFSSRKPWKKAECPMNVTAFELGGTKYGALTWPDELKSQHTYNARSYLWYEVEDTYMLKWVNIAVDAVLLDSSNPNRLRMCNVINRCLAQIGDGEWRLVTYVPEDEDDNSVEFKFDAYLAYKNVPKITLEPGKTIKVMQNVLIRPYER